MSRHNIHMQTVPQKLLTLALHTILKHLPSWPPGPPQSGPRKPEDGEKTLWLPGMVPLGAWKPAGRRRTPKIGSQVNLGRSEARTKKCQN